MARHARSFAPAARLLGRRDRQRVAALYAICRAVDDLADEGGGAAEVARLDRIMRDLDVTEPADPIAQVARTLFEGRPAGLEAFRKLVQTARTDCGPVFIKDVAALDTYADGVAGTVGVMICTLFDVDTAYHRHAAALGRAMQLTNICRDVHEDAQRGRRYLPASLCPQTPDQIATPTDAVSADVMKATRTLLGEADRLYAEGRAGLPALPFRLRLAVTLAAALYQGIGHELLTRGANPLQGRVRLHRPAKIRLAVGAILPLRQPLGQELTRA